MVTVEIVGLVIGIICFTAGTAAIANDKGRAFVVVIGAVVAALGVGIMASSVRIPGFNWAIAITALLLWGAIAISVIRSAGFIMTIVGAAALIVVISIALRTPPINQWEVVSNLQLTFDQFFAALGDGWKYMRDINDNGKPR